MGSPSDIDRIDLQDPRLTLVGLFVEAEHGLARALAEGLGQDTGLSPQRFEVLLRLGRSPDRRLRMSDLAQQVTLTPSGLTRVVDRLEDEGYVRRDVCPTDRRGSFAVLTDEGLAVLEAALPRHVAQVDALFGGALDAGERCELERLLRRLRDHLYPEATSGVPDASGTVQTA